MLMVREAMSITQIPGLAKLGQGRIRPSDCNSGHTFCAARGFETSLCDSSTDGIPE